MLPHQERVVQEKKELDERLAKLRAFFGSELYKTLDQDEQNRLNVQADVMKEYSDILLERIENF